MKGHTLKSEYCRAIIYNGIEPVTRNERDPLALGHIGPRREAEQLLDDFVKRTDGGGQVPSNFGGRFCVKAVIASPRSFEWRKAAFQRAT